MAQERGANALGELIQGLGVSGRVLMIGAHPDDEDTQLIAWLQRGRGVETAYLSLTRGDGGQNLIGNELGEALGVIRTEELMAARRIDGARQYFTRAFDFGFSKDTVDTYAHWPRDSILSDVVRVVRAFRPHVIVAVWSGTSRDGHGHHQVAGLLARAAYDAAGDVGRFPVATHGAPWTVSKFYRAARGSAQGGTLGVDVGEYSPLLGRSYAEIAGESRSQHKSQGFGALQRKGPVMNYVRREASRVNEATDASTERSMFDGIDTTWARFRPVTQRAATSPDSVPVLVSRARAAFDALAPSASVAPLGRVTSALMSLSVAATRCQPETGPDLCRDLDASGWIARARAEDALLRAAGVELEVTASREVVPFPRETPVIASTYNRGTDTVVVVWSGPGEERETIRRVLLPGTISRDTVRAAPFDIAQPLWLQAERRGAMFADPEAALAPPDATVPVVRAQVVFGGNLTIRRDEKVQYTFVDQVRGEQNWPAAAAPLLSATIDPPAQFVVAEAPIEQQVTVRVRAADDSVRQVRVTLAAPRGLRVDSVTRTVRIERYDEPVQVLFRVQGRLPAGEHRIEARVEYGDTAYASGYDLIDYDHIRRQRVYRPAVTRITAMPVQVPAALRVAYVTGVSDNIAPILTQLGVRTTVMSVADLAAADLSPYTTVVVGPRAYDANPDLAAANPKLFAFARAGGTIVVQYGQYEMTRPGMTPYPIAISRPHPRVTHEDAPVTLLDASARALTWPNRIARDDFDNWVQERGLYMPRTFDPQYQALLSMSDPGEPAIAGGVLVAPLGRGTYVYTSLSFFRQLPAGVPGAARLFVNLLSAGLPPAGAR